MENKTFEEKFPSLKNKTFECDWQSREKDAVMMCHIEEHCLDKQKVKEVIEKLSWSGVSQTYNEIDPNELLKELGLNDT